MPSKDVDDHRRLRAIFDEVLGLDPPARGAYLDAACAANPQLRSQVVRLLSAHEGSASFLEHPPQLLPLPDALDFPGTDRYQVLRRLGAGGMGVVYEVRDRLREEVVALKTLRRTGAADLYRLKHEFRSLADVTHPNLACLYELHVENGLSFFTMERVSGMSFVDYVRGNERAHLSVDRLVPALRQLTAGVAELHRRGKLHRDIKPSNVLVTPEGRVVILDFGLIAEIAGSHTVGHQGAGTPAYMSPEEASGEMATEASDWYAVGVTLYEALTGALPFEGAVADVLLHKRTSDPPAPADVVPDVPSDLSALCMGLLHRSAGSRQAGSAALRALLATTSESMPESLPAPPEMPFIGRHDHLRSLDNAYEAVKRGAAQAVAIYGPSGIGKSALVRRFLSRLDRQDEAVVLAGRCYENESVPYKALDGIVDELSRHLGSLSVAQVEGLLPPDIWALSALTRVFPALLQVGFVARNARHSDLDAADPFRLRRRAFEALGEILRRLAARHPLVIWIDDLQWADEDSVVLLDDLLGPPGPPAMLTLLSFRSEEIAAKPFLRAWLEGGARQEWLAISLEPMSGDEAHTLVAGLLRRDSGVSEEDAQRMTQDAGGSPFVLEQLALYAGSAAAHMDARPSFAGMFEFRMKALPSHARAFLETLAICGRPMAPEIICDACGVSRERQALVVMLRASRFIRSSGSSSHVETYHDRIREVLAGHVAFDALRGIHERIASALVARNSDDCEALFEHYRGAGHLSQASIQAGRAAEKASAALAFDRAASFYSHALDMSAPGADTSGWKEALAAALANAGRPAEAAEAFLGAADGAERPARVELQRRAAEQFLIGGHIDRGLDLIGSVLTSVGLTPSRGPRAAAVRLMWRRARLGWRGLKFTRRHASEVEADVLLRLDTCWATATGLGLVDVISASDFIAQHLHLALDAGEPSRIARGMALESSARSADWQYRKGAHRLTEMSKVLAQQVGTPKAMAMELLADSITATAVGQWRRALRSSEQSLTILRDQCVGVTWEMNIAQNMLIWALMYLGEFAEVARRVPALLADARRRGNLYLATEICTRSNIVWLIADDPDEGERETEETIARWTQRGFHRQHYSARLARVQTALYRGDPRNAWRLLTAQESKLRRSMLLHVQAFRIESLYLHARCGIALAYANPSDRRFLSVGRACARRIARERMRWSNPLALLMQAGIASVEGTPAQARMYLEDAVAQFDSAEMGLYAAIARRRLGVLRGDEPGRQIQRQAEAWMATQQVKNPVALTRMLAPGFPDEPVLFLADDGPG